MMFLFIVDDENVCVIKAHLGDSQAKIFSRLDDSDEKNHHHFFHSSSENSMKK